MPGSPKYGCSPVDHSFGESGCTDAQIVGKSGHSHFDLLVRGVGALDLGLEHYAVLYTSNTKHFLRLAIRGGGGC